MSELQQKNDTDLLTLITEKREELRKLRFGVVGSGMRNTHSIRNLRREVAQALTVVRARVIKERMVSEVQDLLAETKMAVAEAKIRLKKGE